jgi:hypothetical protein
MRERAIDESGWSACHGHRTATTQRSDIAMNQRLPVWLAGIVEVSETMTTDLAARPPWSDAV